MLSSLQVISICTGGQFGRDKTLAKVEARYYWPCLVSDVVKFIKECDRCQRVNAKPKGLGPPLHPIKVTTAKGFDKVSFHVNILLNIEK